MFSICVIVHKSLLLFLFPELVWLKPERTELTFMDGNEEATSAETVSFGICLFSRLSASVSCGFGSSQTLSGLLSLLQRVPVVNTK